MITVERREKTMAGRKKVKRVIEVENMNGSLDEVIDDLNKIKNRLLAVGCTEFEIKTDVEYEGDFLSGAESHYVKSTVTGR